ncbi:MAG: hypothetical protein ACRDTN_04530 [Mycobacterium sp.]
MAASNACNPERGEAAEESGPGQAAPSGSQSIAECLQLIWLRSFCEGHGGGERMMSARDEVVTDGLIDWVEPDQIHWYVARENAGEPLSVIQEKTLDLIRSLASDGLFEVGDLTGEGGRFVAWNIPLDESIQRIRNVYVTNFDDQNTWPWFCWLNLTEKGQQVAEAIEAGAESADGS